MNAVYYSDKKTDHCPVKEFLTPYFEAYEDSQEHETMLTNLFGIIQLICERKNIPPLGSMAGAIQGYSLFKIKLRKNKNTLIRILYFCHQDKLILLHGFEKPESYSSSRDKERFEDKQFKIADNNRLIFIQNSDFYEVF